MESIRCRLPVVLWQMRARQRVTRLIALRPRREDIRPDIRFRGADGFRADLFRALPGPAGTGPRLRIGVSYMLRYSDGGVALAQPDRVIFEFPAAESRPAGIFRLFESGRPAAGTVYRVEAMAESFGAVLCGCTGGLILDIGAFFVIRRERPQTLCLPGIVGSGEKPGGGPAEGRCGNGG